MAGTGTWGNINTNDPTERAFVLHIVDASGDHWTQRLVVALDATLAAIQSWIGLYQAITQASIYEVVEENSWGGAADSSNAEFLARSGVENGVNLTFKESTTAETFPLRVVAPTAAIMAGTNDAVNPAATGLINFITGTDGILNAGGADFGYISSQYTSRRERKNNPKVS